MVKTSHSFMILKLSITILIQNILKKIKCQFFGLFAAHLRHICAENGWANAKLEYAWVWNFAPYLLRKYGENMLKNKGWKSPYLRCVSFEQYCMSILKSETRIIMWLELFSPGCLNIKFGLSIVFFVSKMGTYITQLKIYYKILVRMQHDKLCQNVFRKNWSLEVRPHDDWEVYSTVARVCVCLL